MMIDEMTFAGEFRTAQLRYVTSDGGTHRRCMSPGDDLSDLPKDIRAAIEAEWTPEIVAAYIAAARVMDQEPEPPPEPDPRDVKIAALEARLAKVEAAAKITRQP